MEIGIRIGDYILLKEKKKVISLTQQGMWKKWQFSNRLDLFCIKDNITVFTMESNPKT